MCFMLVYNQMLLNKALSPSTQPLQASSVSSATLCARRVACTSGTSRSTSSRGCSSATSATSSSRRPSSCWSTRSATPSRPEGSSKESKYRQRFLTPPVLPYLTPHPLNSINTNYTHRWFQFYSYMHRLNSIHVTVAFTKLLVSTTNSLYHAYRWAP